MANKALFGGLAAILVVAAVVAAVATVASTNHGGGESSDSALSTSTKLSSYCSSTLYPGSCERSLATIVNGSASPEDVVKAAVQVALDEVAAAMNRSADIGKGETDGITQGAIANCRQLLSDAADDLRAIASVKPEEIAKHSEDLRTWLSGVMTYIYTCADGFDKPELKEAMDKALQSSTELSSNALAIVTNLGAVVKEAGRIFNISTSGTSRRLLGWQFKGAADVGGEEERSRLLLSEIANVTAATRHILSATLAEVSDMSGDASRRLLSMAFNDASKATDPNGGSRMSMTLDGVPSAAEEDAKRLLFSMLFTGQPDASKAGDADKSNLLSMTLDAVSRTTEEADGGKRRLLAMTFNDASKAADPDSSNLLSMTLDAVSKTTEEEDGGRHRLLGMTFNDASETTEKDGDMRRLLSMGFNDASDTTEKDGGVRQLLSMAFNDASDTTEKDSGVRRLLSMAFNDASETTEEDGGMRRLLSMAFNDASDTTEKDGGMRRLLSMGFNDASETTEEEGGMRRLLSMAFNDASKASDPDNSNLLSMTLDAASDTTERDGGVRRLLSMMLNEVSKAPKPDSNGNSFMSMTLDDAPHANEKDGGIRRLLSMAFNDASGTTEKDGGVRRLLSMMLNEASKASKPDSNSNSFMSMTLDDAPNANKKDGSVRRLLGLMSDDVPNLTDQLRGMTSYGGSKSKPFDAAAKATEEDVKRILFNQLWSGTPNDTKEEIKRRLFNTLLSAGNDSITGESRRRLLGMTFNDATDVTEGEGARRLLSAQLDEIAGISTAVSRRLLMWSPPYKLLSNLTEGKHRVLAATLDAISDIATDTKRRLLAVNVNGKPEDARGSPHRIMADGGDLPEWLSAHDRKLLQARAQLKPNAVVAKDGSGNFKTITDAINSIPKAYQGRFVIYVKAGVYNEYVTIPKDKVNVYMYGDGPRKTRVVGNRSHTSGYTTLNTRTFSAEGKGFICKSMGFSNTAGPEGHQAVAMHIQGDMSVFYNCRFDGYQDTLYVHANRQFFRNCVISGTIDFIFGNSAAVFQNCLVIVRKPMDNQQNTVTAQGRTDPNMKTGIVIQNCRVVPESILFPLRLKIASYLGRPWKQYARTVVMESVIADFIRPDGWMPWDTTGFALKTLYYAEHANTGPGAGTSKRVNWPGYRVIGRREAAQFTAGPFLDGGSWIKYTGAPNFLGFRS